MTKNDEKLVKTILSNAIKEAFGTNADSGKFVDVSRIPLICKSIIDINKKMEELSVYIINDNNWKKEFDIWKTKIVEPLVKKEADDKTIKNWQLKELKILVTIAGSAVTFYLVLHYWGFLIGIKI